MDERVKGQREEAIERREKDVRDKKEKVVELEQTIGEQEHALDQRGSQLEELQEEMETSSAQLGGLDLSISALGLINGPLLFFGLLSLMCGVTRRLRSNPSSPSNPNFSTTTPSSSSIPLQRRTCTTGKPSAIYTSQQVDGGVSSYSWALACVYLTDADKEWTRGTRMYARGLVNL